MRSHIPSSRSTFYSNKPWTHLVVSAALVLASPLVHAFDQEEARMMARQNGCFKCHGIDKKKDGPAYQEVANKYREDPQAVAKLYHHITAGVMVKFSNGNEEAHKVINIADSTAIHNMIAWLLSL